MPPPFSALDMVQVASPCPVPWETMSGDDRARFCSRCRQQVYSLSGVSRQEAETLLREKEGRLCVRYYQRADGAVMTRDCPEGRRRLPRWLALALTAAFTLLVGVLGWVRGLSGPGPDESARPRIRDQEPFRAIFEWLDPTPPQVMMGKLCPPDAPAPKPE